MAAIAAPMRTAPTMNQNIRNREHRQDLPLKKHINIQFVNCMISEER
jgi:hypothetical protein